MPVFRRLAKKHVARGALILSALATLSGVLPARAQRVNELGSLHSTHPAASVALENPYSPGTFPTPEERVNQIENSRFPLTTKGYVHLGTDASGKPVFALTDAAHSLSKFVGSRFIVIAPYNNDPTWGVAYQKALSNHGLTVVPAPATIEQMKSFVQLLKTHGVSLPKDISTFTDPAQVTDLLKKVGIVLPPGVSQKTHTPVDSSKGHKITLHTAATTNFHGANALYAHLIDTQNLSTYVVTAAASANLFHHSSASPSVSSGAVASVSVQRSANPHWRLDALVEKPPGLQKPVLTARTAVGAGPFLASGTLKHDDNTKTSSKTLNVSALHGPVRVEIVNSDGVISGVLTISKTFK